MTHRPSIVSLNAGESGYTPAHAALVRGSKLYLNGAFPVNRSEHGTFSLRVVKFPNGFLAVDVTNCHTNPFSTIPSVAGDVNWVPVDALMEPPLPDPNRASIFDMKRNSHGFVSMDAAWIHGPHMWIDGLSAVSPEYTVDSPMYLERDNDGAYVVDVRYCHGRNFRQEWRDDSAWPIQVLKAIQARRLMQ